MPQTTVRGDAPITRRASHGQESRGRVDRLDAAGPTVLRQKTAGVPPRGFEPLISTLKGWRPRPLDDGGMDGGSLPEGPGRTVPARLANPEAVDQLGRCDSMNRMIAPARQPAPIIAARPPASAIPTARRSRPAIPAYQVARAE